MRNTAFFIVGNYGVGKSTLIKSKVISKQGIFLEVSENLYVLGKSIAGADSLSSTKKVDVMNDVVKNNDKNIIITGNYYAQIKDIEQLQPYYNCVIIYLKTSFKENALRIKKRGKQINVKTYNMKLKSHFNLMKKCNHIATIHILDNDRVFQEVKSDLTKIIANEKG